MFRNTEFCGQEIYFSVSPDALTRGVSRFLTRMMIVITVRMIPRLAMLMGRMEKLDPSHMYWT